MELQFYGANCVRLTSKRAAIDIDDNLASLGAKSVTRNGDVAVYTMAHDAVASEVKLLIDQPGEYEVCDVSITGIAARGHMEEAGQQSATMYRIVMEDVRVAVLGHVHPDLSNDQLEQLGMIDVLIVPVGGNGYTLDPIGALKLVKAIEPKVIVPTHYHQSGIAYPVPQQTLADAIKGLGMEPQETTSKLRLKATDLGDATRLVVLEKQ